MATRKYEQRLRAENAEDTRRRILDAVYQRLRDAPTEPLSLDHVARVARVARSTIYGVFGSRAGLLDAFTDDLWARTGLPALTAAVAHPDVREHLRGGIAAACRMFASERDVYRVLFSMAQLDPASVGGTVDRMVQERAGGMAHLARRLAEQEVLRPASRWRTPPTCCGSSPASTASTRSTRPAACRSSGPSSSSCSWPRAPSTADAPPARRIRTWEPPAGRRTVAGSPGATGGGRSSANRYRSQRRIGVAGLRPRPASAGRDVRGGNMIVPEVLTRPARPRPRRSVVAFATVAVMAMVAVGCGDDDSSDDATATSTGGAATSAGGGASTTAATAEAQVCTKERQGGELTFSAQFMTRSFDPVISTGSGTTGSIEMAAVYDMLIRWNGETRKFEPKLAKSLTPNANFTEWTLELRPEAKFGNGDPVDATAVKGSIERHLNPNNFSTVYIDSQIITAIDVASPTKLGSS